MVEGEGIGEGIGGGIGCLKEVVYIPPSGSATEGSSKYYQTMYR